MSGAGGAGRRGTSQPATRREMIPDAFHLSLFHFSEDFLGAFAILGPLALLFL